MLPANTDPAKKTKEPCAQGVKPIISTMLQIVTCGMANILWTFHESPLIDFTVILLKTRLGHLDGDRETI